MTNVLTLDLTPVIALKHIRQIACDSNRIIFDSHCEKRMKQRHISRTQVIRCLTHGKIHENPYRDIKTGDWRVTLSSISAGVPIRAGIALSHDSKGNMIVVITTF